MKAVFDCSVDFRQHLFRSQKGGGGETPSGPFY